MLTPEVEELRMLLKQEQELLVNANRVIDELRAQCSYLKEELSWEKTCNYTDW